MLCPFARWQKNLTATSCRSLVVCFVGYSDKQSAVTGQVLAFASVEESSGLPQPCAACWQPWPLEFAPDTLQADSKALIATRQVEQRPNIAMGVEPKEIRRVDVFFGSWLFGEQMRWLVG